MIITETVKLELKNKWQISRGSLDFKEIVVVRIEKDGVVGLGEASPNTRYGETSALTLRRIREAAPIFEKHNLFHYQNIKTALDAAITDQSCAKAALDTALMDWIGKSMNAPLYKLWGFNPDDAPLTSYTIGIDTVEMIRQKTRDAAEFPILKIKLGVENDREIMAAVRSETGKPIRVDANEGWTTREEALEKIRWLETQGVEFVEQPMPAGNLANVAWLRERVNLPLVADEDVKTAADIPRLAGVYDGINIKLMKSGGLLEGLRMIQVARALDLKIMLGCMIESSIAISAAAQLAPMVDWADLDSNLLLRNDPFSGVKVVEGRFVFNDKPGIGLLLG